MKKNIVIAILLVITLVGSTSKMLAQKYAFVDTEYILTNIPSYKAAQDQLDELSNDWQQEIEALYSEIDQMYQDYQTEKVLLTEDMRKKKEDAIIEKERKVKELQKQYFGPEGDLFKKREELIKPIQDEVYLAVKELATEGSYAVIFDTSSGPSILYSNPRYDKSDEVLEKLGYKN